MTPEIDLGRTIITAAAHRDLDPRDVQTALTRHASGDWGDVSAEDRQANEDAIRNGDRLFSVYSDRRGAKFWIITEWDRSATTVLLPSDY